MMPIKRILLILITLTGSLLFLNACKSSADEATPTSSQVTVAPTDLPATATPVPVANKVWLVNGSSLPADQVTLIQNLANQSGLILEQFPSITLQDLQNRSSEVKLAIVLPPDPGLAEMIPAFPQISFITLGITNPPAGEKIYSILPDGLHPERDAYLAGYMAATLTYDSRIGIVTQASTEDGKKRAEGFINGGVMFCGLCNPVYPPYEDYPLSVEINAGSSQAEWQPVIDAFLTKQVKTAYVAPEVASPDLMLYLAQYGVKLISSTAVPAGLEPAWLAVIQTKYDQAIQSAWQDALSQSPAGTYAVQMSIQPVDTSLVTEGKINWFNRVITDLTNGYLIP